MNVCVIVSLAFALLIDAPDPTIALVEGSRKASAVVEGELLAADAATKAGDLAEAVRRAEAAVTASRTGLAPVDPLRARAAMTRARAGYGLAAEAKDPLAKLRWAGEVSRITGERAVDLIHFDSAERWAAAADDLARRHLAEEDPDLHRAAVRLGLARAETARAKKDLPAARSAAESALAHAERSLPPGDGDRAGAALRLARIAIDDGKLPEAQVLVDRVVEEGTGRPDADRRVRVEALLDSAQIRARRLGTPDLAATARVLAEAARSLDPDDPLAVLVATAVSDQVWSRMLADIGGAATADEGAARTADAQLVSAIEAFRAALVATGADAATAGAGRLFLAKFRIDLQRFGEAEAALDSIDRDGGPGMNPLFAGDYWTLRGRIAADRDAFASAGDAFERADRHYSWARLPQQAFTGNNLGLLLLRQGDNVGAGTFLLRAEAFSATDPTLKGDPQRADILTNLAKCFEAEGRLPEAFRKHMEALAIARGARPPGPFRVCVCLVNLGINRYAAGEFEAAAARFTEARALAVASFGPAHPRVAEIDVDRAWLARALDRPDEAEALFRSALATFRSVGDDHPRVPEALSYLARSLAAAKGPKAEARRCLDEALEIQGRTLARALRSPLSERDRLAIVQERRVHPESSAWPGVLDSYLDLAPELGIDPSEQYRRLLAWKGIAATPAPPRVEELEDDPEVRRVAREREARLKALRDASATRLGGRAVATRDEVARIEAEVDALERELARRSPRFARGVVAEPPDLKRVVAALPAGSALVDLIQVRRYRPEEGEFLKDFRYVAFVVRPGRPVVRVDLPETATRVDGAVLAFRKAIETRQDTADTGREVARLIRGPLLPSLDGVGLLIVAGDGDLNTLPFAAIPGPKPGSYWIEDLAIATVPGAASLVERRGRRGSKAEGAVIVGGVDYVTWKRLKGTEAEADEVRRIYAGAHPGAGPAVVISGADATPERLRAVLPSRRYAHLATHGFFQARGGEGLFKTHGASARFDSGLVLAGAGAGVGRVDDLLSAEEIGGLDLRGADLIVLSACESGLGRARAGQGVIGLVGALDRAGARSVVSTLWKVSDEATVPFMATFYRHLWPGVDRSTTVDPARALRAAQVEMIRGTIRGHSGGTYSHPFYWAAFVHSGDPGPAP